MKKYFYFINNGESYKGTLYNLVPPFLPSLLIPSDASVREILLLLDEELHFIIDNLDSNTLFIDESKLEIVEERLNWKLSENVYELGE